MEAKPLEVSDCGLKTDRRLKARTDALVARFGGEIAAMLAESDAVAREVTERA